jgi:hypothetical protein
MKDKVDYKSNKIMLSVTPEMKGDIEKSAKDLGISEAGFLRMLVRFYIKSGGIQPGDLVKREE